MTRSFVIVIILVCCMIPTVVAVAEDAATTAPADKTVGATTKPAIAAPAAKVLVTVGKLQITEADIDEVISPYSRSIPPNRMAEARKDLLTKLIQQRQLVSYLKPAACTDADVVAWKKNIANELKKRNMPMSVEQFIASRKLTKAIIHEIVLQEKLVAKLKERVEAAVSQDKIDALVKAAPVWRYDGTTVQASHVLIMCKPLAPDAEKAAAREKLAGIAKEIAAGKITFADAARKHSGCPSSTKGGDLGAFTYGRMVPPFSEAAFGMKVGQVSDIVETPFGFHLIKVTGRTEGTGKIGPASIKEAKSKLMAEEQKRILSSATKAFPAVMVQAKPDPDTQPATTKPAPTTSKAS